MPIKWIRFSSSASHSTYWIQSECSPFAPSFWNAIALNTKDRTSTRTNAVDCFDWSFAEIFLVLSFSCRCVQKRSWAPTEHHVIHYIHGGRNILQLRICMYLFTYLLCSKPFQHFPASSTRVLSWWILQAVVHHFVCASITNCEECSFHVEIFLTGYLPSVARRFVKFLRLSSSLKVELLGIDCRHPLVLQTYIFTVAWPLP